MMVQHGIPQCTGLMMEFPSWSFQKSQLAIGESVHSVVVDTREISRVRIKRFWVFFLQNASYSIISKLLWVCLGHRKSCENHRKASSAVWIDPYRSISIAGHKHHKLRCLSWQLFGWMKARTCGDALGLVEGRICRKLWEFIDYGFLLLSQWKQTLCSRFAPTYCM